MLDHPLSDAVGAVRSSLEATLLHQRAIEERFGTDTISGEMRWESSYALPSADEDGPAHADLAVAWPTWSQSAFRTWNLTGELPRLPELDVDVVFRHETMSAGVDPVAVLAALPTTSPRIRRSTLERRGGPTLETTYDDGGANPEHAIEVAYGGAIELTEADLADGNRLDELFTPFGRWISATLVTLDDLA